MGAGPKIGGLYRPLAEAGSEVHGAGAGGAAAAAPEPEALAAGNGAGGTEAGAGGWKRRRFRRLPI